MPWTNVPTKVASDPIGSAGWNTYIRDNLNYLKDRADTKHGCTLRRSSVTSWTNNTQVFYQWNAEIEDTDGYHSLVTNTSRITIPSGLDGVYSISVLVQHDTTVGQVGLSTNGSNALIRTWTTPPLNTLSWTGYLGAGEFVECWVYNAGTTADDILVLSPTVMGPYTPIIYCYRVG